MCVWGWGRGSALTLVSVRTELNLGHPTGAGELLGAENPWQVSEVSCESKGEHRSVFPRQHPSAIFH